MSPVRKSKVLPNDFAETSMELPTDTGFYALVGALVGAVPASISAWYTARSTERSHIRKAVMETSKEIWLERAKHHGAMLPYEHFLIYTTLISEFLYSGKARDAKATRDYLDRVNPVMDELLRDARRKSMGSHTHD